MFIQVRLLKGFSQPLWYAIPQDWDSKNLVGKTVRVPLRNAYQPAIVLQVTESLANPENFTIKTAQAIEHLPIDDHYATFIEQLSYYYQVDPLLFLRRTQQFLTQKEVRERVSEKIEYAEPKEIKLTDEQQKICNFFQQTLDTPQYKPTLLHGVTGSGKTEVYKNIISYAFSLQRTVILLLPEVTLAIQFEHLLKKQLPFADSIIGFHSATTPHDKRLLWKNLCANKPMLIVGVHLPILLPVSNLGLIIVDEEHEVGYQEKKHPKINSKEAALIRARAAKIPILLGSATPSIHSLYNVGKKGWHFFKLHQRFGGALPTIKTVLLNNKKPRKNFWISQELEYEVGERLAKKEQCIIFINRRGFCFFMQCKQCSFIVSCAACSVSLTLHETGSLQCHYCGFSTPTPRSCPACKGPEFLKKGIGTQQVVSILEKIFPQARIGRADFDMTSKKHLWQQTLQDFETGALDILVGTQVITKGFHFPRVTLVGILWADLNLHFPFYNASEAALQQLLQVAGRAGRESQTSMVIVQTMTEHPIFNYLNEVDYIHFFNREMIARRTVGYPPAKRLVEVEIKNEDEAVLERESFTIAIKLQNTINKHGFNVQLLGPAKPPVHKIKNIHTRLLYFKGSTIDDLCFLYASIEKKLYKSKIYFTPNPVA